ncbi:uncharacterized protein MONOS_11270 [Monocercomonoides exilis]|uniref:uncharacterized protein n=1 Tax=Monocercomonoides exilis TaxID=2049356 RepID=UPI00355A5390|nr:hypothetical protein MONOS_11270 [Monocercomonoides exilis]|eukprot:MONOS_11270.1-p1 / transcript=MONOS_11270.1 / gene=MONOS_11270 / organism=Monocercomonoides_exilis_PA203 / gene_product=unspecified product / transcript_product=unspecified product / location=Mono_scaffold00556:34914-36138(-) / protein_length=340 / sequence_SO=supercontig / SO=protein_coding / is_pseudo=false
MGLGWVFSIGWSAVAFELGQAERERERMDKFVAIGEVVPQESVPSIALRDATNAIGQVCHGKGMIGVFSVSNCVFVDEWESLRMCAVDLSVGPLAASSAFRWMSYLLQGGIEIASGNYLLSRRGGTAALYVRAPSSDSAHSTSARDQGSSSGVHRSALQRQVERVQREYLLNQHLVGLPSQHKSQLFYQLVQSRMPHGQFFSNCLGHNITFDFEGKRGVLFQMAKHLIARVVGFVACERSVELAARTAARALETVAVQMLHCAFVSALSWEEKKRMEKRVHGENWAVARGTALGRLAGLGCGLVKSAREKGDLEKAGLNDWSRIGAAVPLKVPFGQLQK